MISKDRETEDTTTYKVAVNHEEQYAIWPDDKEFPSGWRYGNKTGCKADCLAYIKEVWVDMRPLSLKKKMAEMATSTPIHSQLDRVEPRSLVDRLCEGLHAVQLDLRPEKSAKLFSEALARDYVGLTFTETSGGSDFGIKLDKSACDLSDADLDNGLGTAHLEGELSVDYIPVRCVVDIDLQSFRGSGCLVRS